MEREKRMKSRYDYLTFFLVPAATLLLAFCGDLTKMNFSLLGGLETGEGALGGRTARRLLLLLWGSFFCLYCLQYLRYLFVLGAYEGKMGRWLLRLSAAFLLTALAIPYTPWQSRTGAALHVCLAFLSPFLLGASVLCFLAGLDRDGRKLQKKRNLAGAWTVLGGIAAAALWLLWYSGFITSLLEVFLVLSLCGYLRYLERLLRR